MKFDAPKLTGTPEQKLEQLIMWLRRFLEELNITLEEIEITKGGK